MKKHLLIILLLASTLFVKAQETPPAVLKAVNAQFYINLADSAIWHNKGLAPNGTNYGWERLGRYADVIKKQDKLVSGTNIKTIGGVTILGSGDLPITYTETDPTVPNYSKTLTAFSVIKPSTDALYQPLGSYLTSETDPTVPSYAKTLTAFSVIKTSTDVLYPALAGSYANPSWITSLPWSKITTTPTTLSGYGITDAQPLNAKLTAFSALANASGVLTNDGSGVFSYTTPTGGTVTSITPGWSFTSSTPITSTGTLTEDSTKVQTVGNFFTKGNTKYGQIGAANAWSALQTFNNQTVFNNQSFYNSGFGIQLYNSGNTFYSALSNPTLTANRQLTPPDASGTLALVSGNLGTPTSMVGTNITGTAAGLTAGNVTTNANLTGEVMSVGNAATLTNNAVIGKVLTGYTSGAGTVSATDNILQAIQKLNGNIGALVTGVSSFNTRPGAVTLTSVDVTTALTFTPEDVANKTATQSSSTTTYPNWLGVTNYAAPALIRTTGYIYKGNGTSIPVISNLYSSDNFIGENTTKSTFTPGQYYTDVTAYSRHTLRGHTNTGIGLGYVHIDSLDRVVFGTNDNGRVDISNYDGVSGATMVLNNKATSTNAMQVGHYAFTAKNSQDSLNTVAGIYSILTDRNYLSTNSSLRFNWMADQNTATGYNQPLSSATLDKNGFYSPVQFAVYKDGSNTIAPYFQLTNAAGNQASAFQLSASNDLDVWSYGGGGWQRNFRFSPNGEAATYGGIRYPNNVGALFGTSGGLGQYYNGTNFLWYNLTGGSTLFSLNPSTNAASFAGTLSIGSTLSMGSTINLKNYTVATLPTGSAGDLACVIDALAPAYGATVVGTGSVFTVVVSNGTNWIVH